MIKIENLSFAYDNRQVLDKISLNVGKGEFVGVVGRTGCGKTTLLLTLNGLIPQLVKGKFSGQVRICGMDTQKTKTAELARKIGFVFQDPDSQIFSLTAREEIAFGLQNMGKFSEKKVSEALKEVGLSGYADADPDTLSQGQKQKLCIASVLAMGTEIMALDEPTASLDHPSAEEIYSLLERLNRNGKTILLASHDTDMLLEHCTRIIVLSEGKIALDGRPEEVFSSKEYAATKLKVPFAIELARTMGTKPVRNLKSLLQKAGKAAYKPGSASNRSGSTARKK